MDPWVNTILTWLLMNKKRKTSEFLGVNKSTQAGEMGSDEFVLSINVFGVIW